MIIIESNNFIKKIILNNPSKLNAVTDEMRSKISRELALAAQDDRVRVVVISGVQGNFCSGADLSDRKKDNYSKDRDQPLVLIGEFLSSLIDFEKPLIAAIDGVAAGVGLSLALACDFRVASNNARFSAIWVKRGLIPDGGATLLLQEIIGIDRALDMALTGRMVEVEEAFQIGLVSEVSNHEKSLDMAIHLASEIAAQPPIAIEITKRLMLKRRRQFFREHLIYETYGQNICIKTQDHKEAISAFIEKRSPKFFGY